MKRTGNRSNQILTLTSAFLSLFLSVQSVSSCGTLAGNPEEKTEETPKSSAKLPDATAIELTGLSDESSLNLTTSEGNCDSFAKTGLFASPLAIACHTTPFASNFLYGEEPDRDNDGTLSCGDYNPDLEDQGFLFSILCEEGFLRTNNVETFRFDENGQTIAISFQNFSSGNNGIGSWTAAGDDETRRYPANIRAWAGSSSSSKTQDSLPAVLALDLVSADKGSVYVDLTSLGESLTTSITYSNPTSAENCKSSPSASNCYMQEMSIKGDADETDGAPEGMAIYILANAKKNPDFILIEAKLTYSDKQAADLEKDFGDGIRELYFRTIKDKNLLWGSFDFRNSSGQSLSPSDTNQQYILRVLRDGLVNQPYAGICQDYNTNEDFVDCKNIDPDFNYKNYDAAWKGASGLKKVTSSYKLPISFGEPPTTPGIVTKP